MSNRTPIMIGTFVTQCMSKTTNKRTKHKLALYSGKDSQIIEVIVHPRRSKPNVSSADTLIYDEALKLL